MLSRASKNRPEILEGSSRTYKSESKSTPQQTPLSKRLVQNMQEDVENSLRKESREL